MGALGRLFTTAGLAVSDQPSGDVRGELASLFQTFNNDTFYASAHAPAPDPSDFAQRAIAAIRQHDKEAGLVPEYMQQFVTALADCVVKATPYGEDSDGFIAHYLMPVGPLHRAMPLLERFGIVVRPGFDGRLTT